MQWRKKKNLSCGDMYKSIAKLSLGLFFYYKERHYRREKEERNFVYDYISRRGTIICTECNVLQDS